MSREIKFRVYCIPDKMWIFWNEWFDIGVGGCDDFVDTDDWKVMQYTGLKDSRGKEIYEGDILGYTTHTYKNYVEVKYTKTDCEECGEHIGFAFDNDEDVVVVGNIYENPELLEEKE